MEVNEKKASSTSIKSAFKKKEKEKKGFAYIIEHHQLFEKSNIMKASTYLIYHSSQCCKMKSEAKREENAKNCGDFLST